MARKPAAVTLVVALTLPGCGRCSAPPADPDAHEVVQAPDAARGQDAGSEHGNRLRKHDWNGITVMMRETELRDALQAIGFSLTPSRLDAFPVLHPDAATVKLWPVQGLSPPIVAFETERQDTALRSVYGLRFWFFRNRLFAFSPVYFADPVDLVEPTDEAVSPSEMKKRLEETFGAPGLVEKGSVLSGASGEAWSVSLMSWSDDDLVVLYREPVETGLPTYDLTFFSPRGNADVVGYLSRIPGFDTGGS